MIWHLSGKLAAKNPPQILVEVGGVGYELDVPMSTFYALPATGGAVSLFTHLVVREDAHHLYGFASAEERSLFRQLIRAEQARQQFYTAGRLPVDYHEVAIKRRVERDGESDFFLNGTRVRRRDLIHLLASLRPLPVCP